MIDTSMCKATAPVCLLVVGISPVRIGGMEIMLKEVCGQLRERGWLAVLALEGEPAPVLLEYFRELASVRFVVAPRQSGLSPRHIPMFWRILREVRPRMVVYAFNGILRLLPWLALLGRARRIIYWEHSSKPIGYVPKAFPLWKRLVARVLTLPVDRVTAVSQYVANCLAVQGLCPAGRITAVHNGVPLGNPVFPDKSREFRREFGVRLEDNLLVQVSWLVPEKGIDMLLRVFSRVRAARPGTSLAIVGDGPKRAEYEQLTHRLGVSDAVHFTGSVSKPSENGVFAAADIYCQMSQWEEACPLVLAEAQAAGRPVVATGVGGIPELVLEGETGYLVGREDEAGAARRIIELLDDPLCRARMGETARLHALSSFDLRRNVTRLLDAWQA